MSIQDTVLLILHYRTNAIIPDGFFKYIYHVRCAINLQSIINSGLIPGGKILSNRQTVFFLPVDLMDKTIRILIRSTWMQRVMHITCIKHGRDIKTQCIGSTSFLLLRKDWSSIRHDRTLSFFLKHSQLIVFRKLLGWSLEKSYTRKYMRHFDLHQRSPLKIIGWKKWVQKLLNDQRDKLGKNFKVPNRTDQFQTQIVIERGKPLLEPIERENPLLELTQEPRKMKEKRPVLRDRNTFFSWRSCQSG